MILITFLAWVEFNYVITSNCMHMFLFFFLGLSINDVTVIGEGVKDLVMGLGLISKQSVSLHI